MISLVLILLASFSFANTRDDRGNCRDPLINKRIMGKVVDRTPDGDPVYENLGRAKDWTPDGDPNYEKVGKPVSRVDSHGIVTGHTDDGTPLYNGEKSPKYSYDSDREYPRDLTKEP